MKQKLEFACECRRSYIMFGNPQTVSKKCPKCGRMMEITNLPGPKIRKPLQDQPDTEKKTTGNIHVSSKASPIKALSNLDETWEYEYKFDQQGRKVVMQEPFTIERLLKKIWALFSFGKSSRR